MKERGRQTEGTPPAKKREERIYGGANEAPRIESRPNLRR